MGEFNDLFDDSALDDTMSFLDEKKSSKGVDGLYRVDLSKVKDKKRGYRAELRFLPNMVEDLELIKEYKGDRYKEGMELILGPSAIGKIAHFVDTKEMPELRGYYDSPKNFGEKCLLSETYYALDDSNNALLKDKAQLLNYSKKYLSYVLVLEDEQQPELEGKIMVFQYGKQIQDKIKAEDNGEITGEHCNIFKMHDGKDFRLIVKELDTGERVFPDYKMSGFKEATSSISLPTSDGLKKIPLEDGVIPSKFQSKVKDFLLSREVTLEDFAPKRLTEEQQGKISQIISYLSGETSSSNGTNTSTATNDASAEDFSFEEDETGGDEAAENKKSNKSSDDFDFDFD